MSSSSGSLLNRALRIIVLRCFSEWSHAGIVNHRFVSLGSTQRRLLVEGAATKAYAESCNADGGGMFIPDENLQMCTMNRDLCTINEKCDKMTIRGVQSGSH